MHSSNLPYARSSERIIGPVKCYSWSVEVDADIADTLIRNLSSQEQQYSLDAAYMMVERAKQNSILEFLAEG